MKESEYLKDRTDLVQKFKDFPFLRNIHSQHLLDMLQLSKLRSYDQGEVITPEGVYDSWIYVLVYGEVVVTKGSSELARFNESGDTFGELAIIDGEARSATVTAAINTKCLAIDASFLDRLPVEEQSAFYSIFYRMLAEILSKRLRETGQELASCKAQLSQLK
ncbi:MAG: cyclic nucleotide-binding domain-containing protein [Bermanella sp.]